MAHLCWSGHTTVAAGERSQRLFLALNGFQSCGVINARPHQQEIWVRSDGLPQDAPLAGGRKIASCPSSHNNGREGW